MPDASRIYEKNATTGKIKAKLYDFTATGRSVKSNAATDTKREAGVLSSQNYDGINYMSDPDYGGMPGYSKDILYKELETEFKKTMESIEKYGGFYIGRYEAGNISSNTPVVRRMNENIHGQNWYKMYPRMKNISNNPNIQTSMIWGSLFDETLEWIIETEDKSRAEVSTNSTSWGNYSNSKFKYYDSSGNLTKSRWYGTSLMSKLPSGCAERNMANNIYDLCGNVYDATLEGSGRSDKVSRGGNIFYDYNNYPSTYRREVGIGNSYSDYIGCRAFLYIK